MTCAELYQWMRDNLGVDEDTPDYAIGVKQYRKWQSWTPYDLFMEAALSCPDLVVGENSVRLTHESCDSGVGGCYTGEWVWYHNFDIYWFLLKPTYGDECTLYLSAVGQCIQCRPDNEEECFDCNYATWGASGCGSVCGGGGDCCDCCPDCGC